MKKIYCVSEHWAHAYTDDATTLACFDDLNDAIRFMDKMWEKNQLEYPYLKNYDMNEHGLLRRESWVDGEYYDEHICIEIHETTCYTSEDVDNGLI